MAEPARKPATYADIEAAPEHVTAEIIGWRAGGVVQAAPFEAIAFPLARLWPLDRPPGFNEDPQSLCAGDR